MTREVSVMALCYRSNLRGACRSNRFLEHASEFLGTTSKIQKAIRAEKILGMLYDDASTMIEEGLPVDAFDRSTALCGLIYSTLPIRNTVSFNKRSFQTRSRMMNFEGSDYR